MGCIDCIAILASIMLITFISACNEYIQKRKLRPVPLLHNVEVVRNLNIEKITHNQLVVGDIVYLKPGDKILFDGILVSGKVSFTHAKGNNEMKASVRTAITSKDLSTNEVNPFIYANTKVIDGKGMVLVIAVGENSTMRSLLSSNASIAQETPLIKKLHSLSGTVGKIGVYISIGTFIAMLCNLLFSNILGNISIFSFADLVKIFQFVGVCLVLILITFPEGLPLIGTQAIAFSLEKMRVKRGTIIMNLSTPEKLAQMNIPLLDKTSVITQNKMSVKLLWVPDKYYYSAGEVKANMKLDMRNALLER
jgi:P-type Ca2+ transporter type 2C